MVLELRSRARTPGVSLGGGVGGFEIVGRSEGWPRPSTPLVFECRGRLGECTIRLGYVPFLTTIAFRSVSSIRGSTTLSKIGKPRG